MDRETTRFLSGIKLWTERQTDFLVVKILWTVRQTDFLVVKNYHEKKVNYKLLAN